MVKKLLEPKVQPEDNASGNEVFKDMALGKKKSGRESLKEGAKLSFSGIDLVYSADGNWYGEGTLKGCKAKIILEYVRKESNKNDQVLFMMNLNDEDDKFVGAAMVGLEYKGKWVKTLNSFAVSQSIIKAEDVESELKRFLGTETGTEWLAMRRGMHRSSWHRGASRG